MNKNIVYSVTALLLAFIFSVTGSKVDPERSHNEIDSVSEETTVSESVEYGAGEEFNRGTLLDCNGRAILMSVANERKFADEFAESHANIFDTYRASICKDSYSDFVPSVKSLSDFTDNIYIVGIDDVASIYTRKRNKTPVFSDNRSVGQSLILTMDSLLQNGLYKYFMDNGITGSMTVLDGDGSIRALVSTPSYNANETNQDNIKEDAQYNRCFETVNTGEIFNLIYAAAVDKYIEDSEKAEVVKAIEEHNKEYFSDISFKMGSSKIRKALDKNFNFSNPMNTDFLSFRNEILLKTPDDLREIGRGYNVKMSPLRAAATISAVVSGEFNKPFIMDKVCDTNNYAVFEDIPDKSETISTVPFESGYCVRAAMKNIAEKFSFSVDGRDTYVYYGTAKPYGNLKNNMHYVVVTVTDQNCSADNTRTFLFQNINSKYETAEEEVKYMKEMVVIALSKEEKQR